MHRFTRNRVSQSALSVALLIGSALWSVGSVEYYATSAFKKDWSATPLFWILVVLVTPAICFGIGIILVDARKRSRFSRLDWCAIVVALFPVTLGTLLAGWAVKVLFSA
jgi:succinate dehydrogenase/fumarate reductase cytochrome b subunit